MRSEAAGTAPSLMRVLPWRGFLLNEACGPIPIPLARIHPAIPFALLSIRRGIAVRFQVPRPGCDSPIGPAAARPWMNPTTALRPSPSKTFAAGGTARQLAAASEVS